ncbi:hypothetical protein DPMN_133547 [Dreissena polymorpha]|uniref:C2H2-type domain-containing protein n=1 Tax=Dreissena polymorpha TaxID=45954 RepID=A0A9D4JB38_DREPO|nr:hypothetical protein DPMN_133547 [Dreissena polymorpha]
MYFCVVCRRDFRSDEKMFLHRREHQDLCQCGVCFQDFSNETRYFKHMETHENYTCMECCEDMGQESLNAHLNIYYSVLGLRIVNVLVVSSSISQEAQPLNSLIVLIGF